MKFCITVFESDTFITSIKQISPQLMPVSLHKHAVLRVASGHSAPRLTESLQQLEATEWEEVHV